LGVIPVLYMSFGDAVTGVVRNLLFGRRTKSWWGNLAMAAVCLPIGAPLGPWGVFSALFASLIEHFEFGPIDDNLTIPLSSFIILYLSYPRWG
jgi:dolichol kinase